MANEMIPFGISRLKWDEGGGYMGADRWLLTVFAWYDGELLTNDQETGLLGLHPGSRDGLMEKIQKYLQKHNELGPVCLVKIKTEKGRNPFLDLAEWDEKAGAPALGDNQELEEPEEEPAPPPPARRPSRVATAPSRTASPARGRVVEEPPDEPDDEEDDTPPTRRGGAPARSREMEPVAQPAPAPRRRASVASPSEPEDEDNTVPFAVPAEDKDQPRRERPNVSSTTIRQWAIAEGYQVSPHGRLSAEIKEEYWKAHDDYYENQGISKPAQAPVVSRPRPTTPPEQAARQLNPRAVPPTSNHGPAAQEMVYTPGMPGQTNEPCPLCEQIVEGHPFPSQEDPNQLVILHMCNGKPQVLAASPVG